MEHALAGVKRSRIVKDVLRNTGEGVSDAVMKPPVGYTTFAPRSAANSEKTNGKLNSDKV